MQWVKSPGMAKIIADAKTDKVLGLHMVAPMQQTLFMEALLP